MLVTLVAWVYGWPQVQALVLADQHWGDQYWAIDPVYAVVVCTWHVYSVHGCAMIFLANLAVVRVCVCVGWARPSLQLSLNINVFGQIWLRAEACVHCFHAAMGSTAVGSTTALPAWHSEVLYEQILRTCK